MRSTEKKIVKLLEKHMWRKRKISSQTRIYHDLWLFGDAAEDFLLDYSKEFDVSFEGFEFKKYFLFEGMPPSYIWIGIKRLLGNKEDPTKIPITISHLAEVSKKKKWFDPPLARKVP